MKELRTSHYVYNLKMRTSFIVALLRKFQMLRYNYDKFMNLQLL